MSRFMLPTTIMPPPIGSSPVAYSYHNRTRPALSRHNGPCFIRLRAKTIRLLSVGPGGIMAKFLIGTSGWVYEHWKGVFYPEGMPQSEWFGHYAKSFDTVEVNYSFYRLPSRRTFENWREGAPPGFVFTVKANRYITHVKKLKDAGDAVKRFYENLYGLEDRCGAVLFQLLPRWHANVERLEEFLSLVPKRYRLVFEFRDESWLTQEVADLLRRHNAPAQEVRYFLREPRFVPELEDEPVPLRDE